VYVTVANIIQYTTGSQCNYLSSGSDGEKQFSLPEVIGVM